MQHGQLCYFKSHSNLLIKFQSFVSKLENLSLKYTLNESSKMYNFREYTVPFKSLNSVYIKKGSTNLHSARLIRTKIIKTFPSQTIRAQRARECCGSGGGGEQFSCETVPQNNFQLPFPPNSYDAFLLVENHFKNSLGTIQGGIRFMAHFKRYTEAGWVV